MRKRLNGGWYWILNIAAHRVSGFRMMFMGHMRWASRKILEAGGGGKFPSHTRFEVGDSSKIKF